MTPTPRRWSEQPQTVIRNWSNPALEGRWPIFVCVGRAAPTTVTVIMSELIASFRKGTLNV